MKEILGYDPNFKFSANDKDFLWRTIRRRFGPQKATLLMGWLEIECRAASYLKKRIDLKSHREMLSAILRNFNQTKIYLDMMEKQGTDEYQRSFHPAKPGAIKKSLLVGISGPKIASINYDSKLLAEKALQSLNRLIETLEYALELQPAKAGRPGRSPSSFIKVIAEDYKEILGEKPKNGGVFLKVVRELLSMLKLPCQDPRRAIREALKGFN